jgi:ribosomal protein S20
MNIGRKEAVKQAVKRARADATPSNLALAYKALDKAAKQRVVHRNRAARLKSRLNKVSRPGTS